MKKYELTNSEKSDLFNKLALLMNSGVTIGDGLLILSDEEKDRGFAKMLKEMFDVVQGGEKLSVALSKTGCFSKHIVGLISVSEQAGRLEETLISLSKYYDNQDRISKAIKNSLTYPSVLLLVMLTVVVVLLTKVLPIFEDVYSSLGGALTGVAGGLLKLGKYINSALPFIWMILGITIVIVTTFCLIPPLSRLAKVLFTKLFADRGIMKKINNAHFITALSIAVSSGLTLDGCVEEAGKLLADSPRALKRVKECQEMMDDGESFAKALYNAGFITTSSCHLISISVQTGGTDRILAQIAERMTENAEGDLEDTVSKLEPMLVIITSFLVGIILISVMLPLINIMKAI